jgi:hypothetical protein
LAAGQKRAAAEDGGLEVVGWITAPEGLVVLLVVVEVVVVKVVVSETAEEGAPPPPPAVCCSSCSRSGGGIATSLSSLLFSITSTCLLAAGVAGLISIVRRSKEMKRARIRERK